ncbi:MAG TPA: maltose alpha-D-glucosyltransferase [Candidatus Binataceae bacterium]|nr:maltose alpha-D-glucosyltransferase [Candidatus Binataceae bacterium]
MRPQNGNLHGAGLGADPLWYKDVIIYEVRVRSFFDTGGDGIGDFQGLTAKLDYLQHLGVTALWLLPFYPSPLRDDGYDIADYMNVHPDCGTLHDFRNFLKEAHRRGLYVITELVLNHTSDQHPWFQRARHSPPNSRERNFYVWSDSSDGYPEARIIFQDFELSNWTWDPIAKAYYWHRFYNHQPDLNFDDQAVRREMLKVVDFWLGMGVDGLRLDAVPYLFEREGTGCENLPETHNFLAELRRHVDRKFPNRMLLAEANQWPEDAVSYMAEGKECNMAFHFPLMPRMFMAVRMEDRFPITDIWAQTPAISENCQWALFLRNHDELTLEMVTDEERDYMYRAYSQEGQMRVNLGIRRRLAPLLGNHRRKIELTVGLLFSLPGTPVIYYGDEIGMGDNVFLRDRDGVRTPMQWSGDRNAGFSSANPQRLILPVIIDYEYHYQTVNVEAQESNPHSLLWWMRRIVVLRKQFKAFGRGSIEFLHPANPRIVAYIRRYGDEQILIVANLSRFVQYVELNLEIFKGMAPIELFGRTPFPPIGDLPYLLTLGPHMFLWFSIEPTRTAAPRGLISFQPPTLVMRNSFEGLFNGDSRAKLERVLLDYLPHCRWFRSKARALRAVRIADIIQLPHLESGSVITLVEVTFNDGEAETYVLPLGVAVGDQAKGIRELSHELVIAELGDLEGTGSGEAGVLHDASADPAFATALLESMERRHRFHSNAGEVRTSSTMHYHQLRGAQAPEPRVLRAEQSNTSIVFGDRLILKIFRRLEPGVNPELEIGRFLTERAAFAHTPLIAGSIEYLAPRVEPTTLGVLQGYVPNHGDAWEFTLHELDHYLERVAARPDTASALPPGDLVDWISVDGPEAQVAELVGPYLESARMMGQRVAELHLALSSDSRDPAFAPEPYSALSQRSVYQSMRNLHGRVQRQLLRSLSALPEDILKIAERIPAYESRIIACFEAFRKRRITAVRMRTHGDLHLGQLLNTGKDFIIIDFEGEPAISLAERRRKHSALRDVAGMLRSFSYAAFAAVTAEVEHGTLGVVEPEQMTTWAQLWQSWASWAFLKEYVKVAGQSSFMPKTSDELRTLLNAFQMEKAVYELGYELNNRPDWIRAPLSGIEQIIATQKAGLND